MLLTLVERFVICAAAIPLAGLVVGLRMSGISILPVSPFASFVSSALPASYDSDRQPESIRDEYDLDQDHRYDVAGSYETGAQEFLVGVSELLYMHNSRESSASRRANVLPLLPNPPEREERKVKGNCLSPRMLKTFRQQCVCLDSECSPDDVCIICLDPLSQPRDGADRCSTCLGCSVLLPCTHRYHSSCIQSWLAVKDSCPLCQRPVLRGHVAQVPGHVDEALVNHEGGRSFWDPDLNIGGNVTAFLWLVVGGCGWGLWRWNAYRDELRPSWTGWSLDTNPGDTPLVPTFDPDFDDELGWNSVDGMPFWLNEALMR